MLQYLPHEAGGISTRSAFYEVPYTGQDDRLSVLTNVTRVVQESGVLSHPLTRAPQQLAGSYPTAGVSIYTGNLIAQPNNSPGVPIATPRYQDNSIYARISNSPAFAGVNPSYLGFSVPSFSPENVLQSRYPQSAGVNPTPLRPGATGELILGRGPIFSADYTTKVKDCTNPGTFTPGTLGAGPDFVENVNVGVAFGLLLSPILRASIGKLSGLFTPGYQYLPTDTLKDYSYTISSERVTQASHRPYLASAKFSAIVSSFAGSYAFYRGKYQPLRQADSPDII